jgi:hypothetical protein
MSTLKTHVKRIVDTDRDPGQDEIALVRYWVNHLCSSGGKCGACGGQWGECSKDTCLWLRARQWLAYQEKCHHTDSALQFKFKSATGVRQGGDVSVLLFARTDDGVAGLISLSPEDETTIRGFLDYARNVRNPLRPPVYT